MSGIPIILINKDRPTYLEKLIDQLLVLDYDNIFVLDMDSSYPPLIEYYDTCKNFTLIRSQNTGHKALWTNHILKDMFSQYSWVAVSDSDIELSEYTPKGFIEDLICIAKDFRVDKAGLALRVDDISNIFLKNIIEPIERRYWQHKLPHPTYDCYSAPIDTTFCVVRPDKGFDYRAVRVGGIMTAKHMDWYLNFDNLTEEQLYYFDHADAQVATIKQHYLNYKSTI